MQIILAETAGFCFGVNRAVNKVEDLLSSDKKVATLGPLIHNPQYIDSLCKRGAIIADAIRDVPDNSELVIRAHGITKQELNNIKNSGISFFDATCPFVKKIQNIVDSESTPDNIVVIAGDENHPEVKGFRSYCRGYSYVFRNYNELEILIQNHPEFKKSEIVYVAQTTFSIDEYKKSTDLIKKVCTNVKIFDTICDATSKRQKEACNLSHKCDIMIVIGGKNSSNTQKLKAVCEENTKTVLIESAEELKNIDFSGFTTIGVTAGASTPVCIIKEVISKMSETITNNVESAEALGQAVADSEMSFEQALEESLKSLNSDQKVVGTVLRVTPTEIQVDIGRKQTGIIPYDEFSADPTVDPAKAVKVGDELNLIIMKTNDVDGFITLSKKRYDAQANWAKVAEAKTSGEVLSGTVAEILNRGVIVVSNSVRVFIPASQATLSKNDKLEDLLGKQVDFKIIDVDERRKRVVGSISVILKEERKASREAFWSAVEVGQKYTGTVVSLTQFGAFVELAPGVHGLCHRTELSWNRIKHPSEVVNVGDTVEVVIKNIDTENKKISLSYKKLEDNPWEILKRDYPVGSTIEVQIVSLTTFGAFAQVMPHIQGLIHISQIANHRVEKPQDELNIGDKVNVMITDIDFEKKHVALSIRALLAPEAVEEEVVEEADELPEGTPVSIDELLANAEAEAAAEE
ncbi:MAG: bifunctional 4-hydroxy-3-methylbut-2-enyl diphosphate reductase/30S ribosomal protein S1 [Clostridia bacterium]|nr:bifunctional 4-hydroxy-3-methylbut-2-enyl diphosphate reductase/30S ribosomal protein S1 [Clostridia bacterium]